MREKEVGKAARGKIPTLLQAADDAALMLKVIDRLVTWHVRIGFASPCHKRIKKIRRALAKAMKPLTPPQKAEKE